MSNIINCPKCGRKLQLPDSLFGTSVMCPSCQESFEAPSGAPFLGMEQREAPYVAANQENAEPFPPSRRRRDWTDEDDDEDEEDRSFRRVADPRGAREAVKGPAIGLMVAGGIALALGILNFGVGGLAAGNPNRMFERDEALGTMIGGVIEGMLRLALGSVIFAAGLKMNKLRNFGLVMAGSILAMLPCSSCCLIGLPIGIWAIVVINRPEVKEAFR